MANATTPLPSPLPASRGQADLGTSSSTTSTSTPTSTPTPTPTPTSTPTLTSALTSNPFPAPVPSSGSSLGPLAVALLLAALAAAALVLARRHRAAPRLVQIVESASLGPKRALVVARLGDELLVLGSSEGGIALLATRPVPLAAPAEERRPAPATLGEGREVVGLPAALGGLLRRLRPAAAAPRPARFERVLTESLEDAELRGKLAAGRVGSVR